MGFQRKDMQHFLRLLDVASEMTSKSPLKVKMYMWSHIIPYHFLYTEKQPFSMSVDIVHVKMNETEVLKITQPINHTPAAMGTEGSWMLPQGST